MCDPYTGQHTFTWASNSTTDTQIPDGALCQCGAVTYKQPCAESQHDWRDVYYGIECTKCGTFYPDGCEPWLPIDDDDYDEYDDLSAFGTCETCGGEYWPGGTSCTCDWNED